MSSTLEVEVEMRELRQKAVSVPVKAGMNEFKVRKVNHMSGISNSFLLLRTRLHAVLRRAIRELSLQG